MEQGVLQLTLAWDGKQIVAAGVASTRPAVAQALRGLAVARALEIIPRLFSLCPGAQGTAARMALRAARGEPLAIIEVQAAALKLALEAIAEHLWRLLLDWPVLCGQPARESEFITWRKRLAGVADPDAAVALGSQLAAWLDGEETPCPETVATFSTLPFLPRLSAAEWVGQLDAESFAEAPTFAGRPAETGALARRHSDAGVAALLAVGQRPGARLAARHADLRWLAQGLAELPRLAAWLDAAPGAEGCGLACIETARGTLLHQIQLDGDRVGRYVIVAPTEWNFHPQGAFVCEIVGGPAATRAEVLRSARALALSLDPCVSCELSVNDA